jgi:two-component system response regulator FixJ
MPTSYPVHIIDDDEAARHSLEFLLRSGGIASVSHDSAETFLSTLPNSKIGCVITDIRMPGINGIELMAQLRKGGSTVPVIVITGHGDIPLAVEAMKLGAIDFLEKPFDDDAILSAIDTALNRHKDQTSLDSERAAILERIKALSNRERQVLDGLILGHPNKTIAYDLNISSRTVEIYRANLMSKMSANSLSALVRMSMIAGISGNR